MIKFSNLLIEFVNLKFQNTNTSASIDAAEQYSRRSCLCISGVVSYRYRAALFTGKTRLNDKTNFKGVYINEDLTRYRASLLRSAKKLVKEGKYNSAWSFDGRIFIKTRTAPDISSTPRETLKSYINIIQFFSIQKFLFVIVINKFYINDVMTI